MTITNALVFVPGVGFRAAPALTLGNPVIQERGEWSVTIERLIAGPERTELGFSLTGRLRPGADSEDAPQAINDPVKLREPGGRVIELAPGRQGPMEWSAPRGSSLRVIRRSLSFAPLTSAGTSQVEVLLSGASGDWTVPLELTPVSTYGMPAMRIESADKIHGVMIAARAIARSETLTAIDVHTSFDPTPLPRFMRSLGPKVRARGDPPQFTLTDDTGLAVDEFASWRDTVASGRDLHEILVFPALNPSAKTAMLSIPDIRLSEFTGKPVTLPIPSEADIELGRYRAHARVTRAQGFGGSVVRVELDDGGWHESRRLIYAESVRVDGVDRGIGWQGVRVLEPPVAVDAEDPSGSAREVTLETPLVQLRGPWRLEIKL